jgi:hypothetical protein
MANLGLVKMGDDPTKNFIPLLEGLYLGRTPKELLKVSTTVVISPNSSSDGNDASRNSSSPKKTKTAEELAKLRQKYAPLGIVDDSKSISRECLQVTQLSPHVIQLMRNQPNVPGKQPIHIVQVHPNMVSKSILPKQTVKLRCNDVLQIHQPDLNNSSHIQHSFRVVPEPTGWQEQKMSSRLRRRPTVQQKDTNMTQSDMKLPVSNIIIDVEEEAPILLPPSFWNPTWGGEFLHDDDDIDDNGRETIDISRGSDSSTPIDVTDANDSNTIPSSVSNKNNASSSSSSFRDLNLSTGQLYWKQLNNSIPHVGAMFLHMTLQLPQQLPSLKLCQDLLQLLTWGPHTTEHLHGTTSQFFWDGPRLHHAMALLRNLLRQYPEVMVPRLSEAAPLGWWKAIMDDIISHRNDDVPDENLIIPKRRKVAKQLNDDDSVVDWKIDTTSESRFNRISMTRYDVEKLRMQSCSLKALMVVLQASLDYEQQDHFPRGPCASETASSEDDNTVDESTNEAPTIDCHQVKPSLAILQALRSYGSKTVLQTIANTLAHVWIEQKWYLGGFYHTTVPPHDVSLWNAYCDVAEAIVSQLSELFSLAWKILSDNDDPAGDEMTLKSTQHRRRGHRSHRLGLSDGHDVRQILWNAMDMQMTTANVGTEEEFSPPNKSKKAGAKQVKQHCISTKGTLLLGWIRHLEIPMGKDFASKLAQQASISDQYHLFSGVG